MISALLVTVTCLIMIPEAKDDRPELAAHLVPDTLRNDAYDVTRESVTTYEIISPKAYLYRVREAITILDNRSSNTTLYAGYDKHCKARVVFANIYDAQGTLIRKIKKDEIQDVSAYDGVSLYSDNRMLVLELPGGRLPYTLEYEYEISYNATMSYPTWRPQGYSTAVQRAELFVMHPVDCKVYSHERNIAPPVTISSTPGTNKRNWVVANAKAVNHDTHAPPREEIFPAVYMSPALFEVEGHSGAMTDWKSFGRFIHQINEGRDALSPAMAQKVKLMTAEVRSDEAKIDLLYNYLKSNTRYVSVQLGIGGWQSYSATYVENNKYGDCKALSYFMKGMLAEAGIKAYPVLVGWDKPSFMQDEIVTPGSFNHMMLYLPDHEMWLECTSSSNPTGYIYDGTSDRDVLLITNEGGVRKRTPARAIENSGIATVDSIALAGDVWQIKGSRRYTAGAHDMYREIGRVLSSSDQQKFFRESCKLSVHKLHILQYSAEQDKPHATCTYNMDVSQFGSVSGPRMFLPVNPFYHFEADCKSGTRALGIFREYPLSEENSLYIQLPEGYQVEGLPEPQQMEDTRFGKYQQTVQLRDEGLMITRALHLYRMRLPAEDYPALCNFYKAIDKSDRSTIVIKKIGP